MGAAFAKDSVAAETTRHDETPRHNHQPRDCADPPHLRNKGFYRFCYGGSRKL